MKAEELMAGDWVLIKRTPSYEYPYKICSINNYSIFGEDYADWIESEAGEEINLEDIKPIPLTAEILEKNGFKEKGVFYCLDTFDYYGLYICEITESIWRVQFYNHECSAFDSIICVGYVHELQHALRLCGIDKEIVL